MPAIGVGSMRKYQRKVKESQPWSVATTSNLVGPWAVLAVWPAMKVALVAYWGVEIYLGDVVGWVGMERGDGGCERKVGGGDVRTGGGRLGVIALVLSEKRWKSSVTLLAARAGSSFSKKLIQRWRSVLASWLFKQPCRSRWLSSWSSSWSFGCGDAMTVVRRARRIERNRIGLRILAGVLVALQRVSFGVAENNQKRKD